MDPLSENFDMIYSPKIEPETDTDNEDTPTPTKKPCKMRWGHDDTVKLIDSLRQECPELWDSKHAGYKDRALKLEKQEYLAAMFGTTVEEITRKVHNLRTQFNGQLRKMKKRRVNSSCDEDSRSSTWEYFENLSFLLPGSNDRSDDADIFDPFTDIATDSSTCQGGEVVNIALAQFQAEEEGMYGAEARANAAKKETDIKPDIKQGDGNTANIKKEPPTPLSRILSALARIIENGPPPSPVPINEMTRIRPRITRPDESQIFADFVASELRMLRTDQARSKLKRLIQTAILQVGKEEDRMLHNLPAN